MTADWSNNQRPITGPSGRPLLPALAEAPSIGPTADDLLANGVVTLDSRDLRSRPFNLLRTNLLRRFESKRLKTLGIVSPCAGAGKSFVASNLAAAFARVPDIEVSLFDLDLRGATIAQLFGMTIEAGIERYLGGEVPDLHGLGYRLEGQSLIIYPACTTTVSSAELLAGKPCAALLDAAARKPQGAVSIFDLPPAFANDDAAIVAAKLDGYLLIVEDGTTTRKEIEDALRVLPAGKCVGTILNRYSWQPFRIGLWLRL